jgi:hypothetical protein
MKCSSSLIRDTLRLSLFHGWIPASNSYAMRTVWVTWRMRELLSLWENDHDEFVSLNVSLIVTFNGACYRFVGCFKKDERGKNRGAAIARRVKIKWIHRREPKPAPLEDRS